MSSLLYIPRNLLVTGGAGFIGANFIRYYLLHHANAKIINLDLLTYAGSLKNLPNNLRHHFIEGDICNAALVAKIVSEHQIDTIVHFAAESHVDRSISGPAPFIQTNVVGTFTLLEAARHFWLHEKKWNERQCRFHHISTDEVYGTLNKSDPAFTEETPYTPNSPYSASKAGSDHLVRAYSHTYHLPVTVSNCSNNYGPYQHPEKFIPTIIKSCLEWKPIPVYGDGSNIRDWLYVEDHCSGVDAILSHGKIGEAYNLGGEHEVDNLTLVKHICKTLDVLMPREKSYSSLINFVTDRPGHDWRYAMDISKISRELNWKPRETFESGLRKTIEFYMV
jgi:dTDP-glucose 4,6-dehydratase